MRSIFRSFGFALKGLQYAFKTQINFKIHLAIAFFVVVLGWYTSLSVAEWLWVIFAIAIVLIIELINTAIEVLVDLVSPEYHIKAGIVKDVSAGAVILTAFLAVLIGLIIFVPKLF